MQFLNIELFSIIEFFRTMQKLHVKSLGIIFIETCFFRSVRWKSQCWNSI